MSSTCPQAMCVAQPMTPPRSGGSPQAMSILEERFARGEIDREEFEERRRALGG